MCEDDSFLPAELLSSANAAAAVQNENPMTTMKRGTNAPVRPLAEGPPLVEIPHNFFIKTLLLTSNQYPIGCSFRSIEIPSSAGTCKDRDRTERETGIEPAWPAWKAGTLPLSYARADSASPARTKLPRARETAKRFFPPPAALDISVTEV